MRAIVLDQELQLFDGFDAFCNQIIAQLRGDKHNRLDNRFVYRADADAGDEGPVNLDLIDREMLQVIER
ncbi:hypothetical protein D3C80_1925960 [compost metagenome]